MLSEHKKTLAISLLPDGLASGKQRSALIFLHLSYRSWKKICERFGEDIPVPSRYVSSFPDGQDSVNWPNIYKDLGFANEREFDPDIVPARCDRIKYAQRPSSRLAQVFEQKYAFRFPDGERLQPSTSDKNLFRVLSLKHGEASVEEAIDVYLKHYSRLHTGMASISSFGKCFDKILSLITALQRGVS